jgi:hypothetical protein
VYFIHLLLKFGLSNPNLTETDENYPQFHLLGYPSLVAIPDDFPDFFDGPFGLVGLPQPSQCPNHVPGGFSRRHVGLQRHNPNQRHFFER